MARPLRIQYSHAYYHVTCRGNDRRSIYRDDTDRTLFLEKLRVSIEIYDVKLHAYVLMGNHFHLMVETPRANLSEFMRHFNISYTGAFNRRHRRVGHLYQGRYKAILLDKDSYLAELSRYVHLNPVRIKPHQGKSIRELRGSVGRERRLAKEVSAIYRRRANTGLRHTVGEGYGAGCPGNRRVCCPAGKRSGPERIQARATLGEGLSNGDTRASTEHCQPSFQGEARGVGPTAHGFS